jgi:hypothetical protein
LAFYLIAFSPSYKLCDNKPINPRIHQESTKEHQEILQSFTLLLHEKLSNGTKITRENWERMRESGERFWYNGVTVKNSCQNEEKGLPFKGRKEERLLLEELQVSPIQERERTSQGGRTFTILE